MTLLAENYRKVLEQVKQAALDAGRKPEEVRLLAVSKTFPAEDVRTVFDAGQLCFGEAATGDRGERRKADGI